MPPLCPFCRHCCRCFVEYLPCCSAEIRNTTCAMYGCSARRQPWLPWWPFPANPLTRRRTEAYCCLGMARWRSCRARSSLSSLKRRPGREEAWPTRRCPRRSRRCVMLVLTTPLATHGSQSTFCCTSTGALLKRRPGREEAWPARRCPRLSAGPGERRRGLSVAVRS